MPAALVSEAGEMTWTENAEGTHSKNPPMSTPGLGAVLNFQLDPLIVSVDVGIDKPT
jgi:hypothetical protein